MVTYDVNQAEELVPRVLDDAQLLEVDVDHAGVVVKLVDALPVVDQSRLVDEECLLQGAGGHHEIRQIPNSYGYASISISTYMHVPVKSVEVRGLSGGKVPNNVVTEGTIRRRILICDVFNLFQEFYGRFVLQRQYLSMYSHLQSNSELCL